TRECRNNRENRYASEAPPHVAEPTRSLWWQLPRVEGSPAGNDNKLTAVEFESDWRIADAANCRMPQCRTVARAQGQNIAGGIAGKCQTRFGCHDAGGPGAVADVVAPLYRSRSIVDCANGTSGEHVVVGAGPAELAVFGLGKVDAVAVLCANDQKSGERIEARRAEIRRTAFIWSDQATVTRRLLLRVRNRAALLVNAPRPVKCREWRRQQILTSGPVEHEKIAITRRLQQ